MFDPRRVPSYFYPSSRGSEDGDGDDGEESGPGVTAAAVAAASAVVSRRSRDNDRRGRHSVVLEVSPQCVNRPEARVRLHEEEEDVGCEADDEEEDNPVTAAKRRFCSAFSLNLDEPVSYHSDGEEADQEEEEEGEGKRIWRSTLVVSWTKDGEDPKQVLVPGEIKFWTSISQSRSLSGILFSRNRLFNLMGTYSTICMLSKSLQSSCPLYLFFTFAWPAVSICGSRSVSTRISSAFIP